MAPSEAAPQTDEMKTGKGTGKGMNHSVVPLSALEA